MYNTLFWEYNGVPMYIYILGLTATGLVAILALKAIFKLF